jgi:hypothetical protein
MISVYWSITAVRVFVLYTDRYSGELFELRKPSSSMVDCSFLQLPRENNENKKKKEEEKNKRQRTKLKNLNLKLN